MSTISAAGGGALGVRCNLCRRQELDRGRFNSVAAIMAAGRWAQSLHDAQYHLCAGCYRELKPIDRESYWRRQPRAGGPARTTGAYY